MSDTQGTAGRPQADRPDERWRQGDDVARGIADGFAEASRAFSDELAGAASYGGLAEGLVAGVLRANGRFLDELAQASRRMARGVGDRLDEHFDDGTARDERLAEMVALRVTAGAAADIDYERLADLVAARLRRAPGGTDAAG